MEYDEYETPPDWRERATELAHRAIPYALAITVLCIFLWIVCSFAARIDNPGASSQWSCTLDAVRRGLKNRPDGQ